MNESGGALSKLAVMDATGRITMSTKRFSESIMLGRKIKSADELNRFVETAKPEEINALSSFLGIEDWRRETIDSINRKIDAARADGRFEQLKNEFKAKKVTSSTGEGVGNGQSDLRSNVPTPVPTGDSEKVKAAEKDAASRVKAARTKAAEQVLKEQQKRSKREEHWKTTANGKL